MFGAMREYRHDTTKASYDIPTCLDLYYELCSILVENTLLLMSSQQSTFEPMRECSTSRHVSLLE